MNPQDVQAPLIQQLALLTQVVHESPYLSHDGRKELEQELTEFSEKLKEGIITFPQGEKTLKELNKKAATDEIVSLITKIGHLNPSSPRLAFLRELSRRLTDGEISPEEVRRSIQDLMRG
ncbi:MAG: hypothetical protein JJU12_06010 [Chlamydiales bacterium]|nr:hypothetical protein [Chlamydiales bacterium]